MKRFLVLLILMSYSIASFGVSLNYFYCCGELKTISLKITTEKIDCKAKAGKGCCDNKTVTLKLKADQKGDEQPAFQFSAPFSPVTLPGEYYGLSTLVNKVIGSCSCKRPPDNLISRNILFCVFRI